MSKDLRNRNKHLIDLFFNTLSAKATFRKVGLRSLKFEMRFLTIGLI